jgi:hypothetical protein
MAIKPIKRYGLLTPTGVDPTVGNRMKALAGIADGVRGLAVGVGKAKAESEAPAEALREAREAIEEGRPVEKRGVLEFGADTFNKNLIMGFAAGKQNAVADLVARTAEENPTDFSKFSALVSEGYKPILNDLPEEARMSVDSFYNKAVSVAGESILAAQNKIAQAKADKEQVQANNAYDALQSNLAVSGNLQALAESLREQDQANQVAGIKDFEKYEKTRQEKIAVLEVSTALGEVRRGIINAEMPPEEKVQQLNAFIKNLKNQAIVQVPDLEKEGQLKTVDDAQRKKIINAVETEAKDYKALLAKEIEQNTLIDRINKVKSYQDLRVMVSEDNLTSEQKTLKINEASMNGEIGDTSAGILRRYVTSKKALTATTKPAEYGELIDRVYNINAQFAESAKGADYLEGLEAIEEAALVYVTNGDLTQKDYSKLINEINNLTAAREAGALSELAGDYTAAKKIINNTVRSDLRGETITRLFRFVEQQMLELESQDENLSQDQKRKLKRNLWKQYALSVSNTVVEEEREKMRQKVTNILQEDSQELPQGVTVRRVQ